MKWLIGLSAAQLVLLAMIGLRMIAIHMRTDEIADTAEAAKLAAQSAAAKQGSARPQPALQAGGAIPNTDILPADDNETLRQIIREELAAWNSGGTAARSGRQQSASGSAASPEPNYDPAKVIIAQSAFDQEFDRYKSRGVINTREMDELHAKIAQLPPDQQRAALIKLTRAINNGEIDGQF